MAGNPTFYLFAGPNGSGKSTLKKLLYSRFPAMAGVEFVNADDIAKQLGGEDTQDRADRARALADARRAELLKAKLSFCSETVFSHHSKIELVKEAKKAGFKIFLLVVCVENPDLSQLRVNQRVQRGGHRVPSDRIRDRFPRALENLEKAIILTDCCLVFDNSTISALPRIVLALENGKLVHESRDMPQWADGLWHVAKAAGATSTASGSLQELMKTIEKDAQENK
jgi:predicted ABC-type ATPase